jgi:serine/threonine protein kinase
MKTIKSAFKSAIRSKAKINEEDEGVAIEEAEEKAVEQEYNLVKRRDSQERLKGIKLTDLTTVVSVEESKVDIIVRDQGFTIKDKILGRGAFGVVRSASRVKDKSEAAVKVISLPPLSDRKRDKRVTDLKQELMTLTHLGNHSNVINTYGHCLINDSLYIFMELADGMPLDKLVKSQGGLEEHKCKKWFFEICLGINFIHSKGISHRDIKLENILLKRPTDKNGKYIDGGHRIAKVSDFGLSRVSYTKELGIIETDNWGGTIPYMSPELVKIGLGHRKKYDPFATDIWATGVLLYSMLYKSYPFNPRRPFNRQEFLKDQMENFLRFPKIKQKKKPSDDLKDLLKQMMTPNPNKRINFRALFSHPWINSIDYNFNVMMTTVAADDSVPPGTKEEKNVALSKTPKNTDDAKLTIAHDQSKQNKHH